MLAVVVLRLRSLKRWRLNGRLIRAASHFIWTRPDGKQFVCRTFRQLVARVYDYDGHLLQGLLRMVKPCIRRS